MATTGEFDYELALEADECQVLAAEIYDIISTIQDPEKPETLADLNVILESGISLCLRTKLERTLVQNYKLDIFIQEGSHSTADESELPFIFN
ncbi:Family with sequence similarity 96, member [Chamberlinius hualienensis]